MPSPEDRGTADEVIRETEFICSQIMRSMSESRKAKAIGRLVAVRMHYLGYGVDEISDVLCMSPSSIYAWLREWETSGLDSLVPDLGGGRRCYLTDEQLVELRDMVDSRKMTTAEAKEFIRRQYSVDYSTKQVHVNLKKLGLRHVRPYELEDANIDDETLMSTSEMRWTSRFHFFR